MAGLLKIETYSGAPLAVSGRRVTPFYQVVQLGSLPRARLSWVRPTAVLVRQADGTEQVLPIVDHTRRVIWAAVIVVLLYALLQRRR
ncbi:MAG: hypothetical protein ACKOC5_09855 [Chloroflexota bacterium]